MGKSPVVKGQETEKADKVTFASGGRRVAVEIWVGMWKGACILSPLLGGV